MSKTARQAERIDGRRVVDWDINGVPILEGRELPLPRYDNRERQCCGSLVTGPHKMGCYQRLNAAPTDHCEDIHHMVPCAVCAAGHATLQRDDAGYYRACEACGSDYAGADELALRHGHFVDADKMVKPCRTCGPGGCADSVSCPRSVA